MYAVVTIAGKQYTVSEKQIVFVDRLAEDEGKTLKFDALLVGDGKTVSVGTPTVPGAMVKVKVISHDKGEKIDVRRYKSKVRYRKHIGFRPYMTKLEVLSVDRA